MTNLSTHILYPRALTRRKMHSDQLPLRLQRCLGLQRQHPIIGWSAGSAWHLRSPKALRRLAQLLNCTGRAAVT
jgi:hypothetical protein